MSDNDLVILTMSGGRGLGQCTRLLRLGEMVNSVSTFIITCITEVHIHLQLATDPHADFRKARRTVIDVSFHSSSIDLLKSIVSKRDVTKSR